MEANVTKDKVINKGLLDAGAEHSKKVREAITARVRETMQIIDQQTTDNHGIYPENGGRLGKRELCRRAGIHYQTLQTPAHKDSTRLEVEAWLAAKKTKTKQQAKTAVTEKADYWREQHQIVATKIHIHELEVRDLTLENNKLKETLQDRDSEIARMKEEIATLRKQVTGAKKGNNVTPLRPHPKGK